MVNRLDTPGGSTRAASPVGRVLGALAGLPLVVLGIWMAVALTRFSFSVGHEARLPWALLAQPGVLIVAGTLLVAYALRGADWMGRTASVALGVYLAITLALALVRSVLAGQPDLDAGPWARAAAAVAFYGTVAILIVRAHRSCPVRHDDPAP